MKNLCKASRMWFNKFKEKSVYRLNSTLDMYIRKVKTESLSQTG